MKKSQKKRVLEWLNNYGSITTWEAFSELHIMCLPKRIEELRKEGYLIKTDYVYLKDNKFGIYRLMEA